MEELSKAELIKQNLALKSLLTKIINKGGMFICGSSSVQEGVSLPDYISVCPVEGLDWFVSYKKDVVTSDQPLDYAYVFKQGYQYGQAIYSLRS